MTRGKATVRRASNETSIFVDLDLGGEGRFAGPLGDPLLTHLLETFVRYAGIDLRVEAKGDETHHVAEDVAHTAGRGPREAPPPPRGGPPRPRGDVEGGRPPPRGAPRAVDAGVLPQGEGRVGGVPVSPVPR